MPQPLRWILGWLASAAVITALATLVQTQVVIGMLPDVAPTLGAEPAPVPVDAGERLDQSGYDLFRLGSLYGLFILAATLVAWLAAEGVARFAPVRLRWVAFVVAGAVAMLVMLFFMRMAFFNVDILAGARDAVGKGLQALAGATGGYLMARLTRRRRRSRYAVD